MIKSGLISLLVLILLIGAAYIGIFDWAATNGAMWFGLLLVAVMLLVAFLVLGSPFKRPKN